MEEGCALIGWGFCNTDVIRLATFRKSDSRAGKPCRRQQLNTLKCVVIVFSSETFNVAILVVAGKKFEAIEGQNVTISFDIDEVEKADEVRVSFKDDVKKEYYVLLAQKPWLYDDPPDPAVTLILGEGYLSVIIQNISISRSGLYKAETYTREKVSEETATLVVHTAPVSSTTSPPHSSSSPNPLRSADLRRRYGLIPVFIIILCFCFWKYGMIPCFKERKNREPVPVIVCPST